MDVLKVVQQLRDLAADPQNRATIVRVRHRVNKQLQQGRGKKVTNLAEMMFARSLNNQIQEHVVITPLDISN